MGRCCGLDVVGGKGAGGNGAAALQPIQRIDISQLVGVQGAWDFQGNLNDRSGNGFDLVDNGPSPTRYGTFEGKQAVYVEPNTRLERNVHDAALAITGALTIHVLYANWGFQAGTGDYLVSFHDPGAHPAGHSLYSVYASAGLKGPAFFSEPAPGTVDPMGGFPPAQWCLHSVTRGGGGDPVPLLYYLNGVLVHADTVNKPTGGTASRMGVGCRTGVASSAWAGWYGDVSVQNVEDNAATVLAVAQQVGVAP